MVAAVEPAATQFDTELRGCDGGQDRGTRVVTQHLAELPLAREEPQGVVRARLERGREVRISAAGLEASPDGQRWHGQRS